jgi:hypothetical protein
VRLDLPNDHRIPLSWLLDQAGETVRYRSLTELAPPGYVRPEDLAAAHQAIVESKPATSIVKKQKDNGIWAGNVLGLAASAAAGIKDVGTIPQYRRLLQLAYPREARPFKLTERVLYRLLSRDEDPALLYEFGKLAKTEPMAKPWARNAVREAATAALAEAGHLEDPRVRGAAHKIANEVSHFLRSPLAEKPFVRSGSHTVLHADATPPSWYSVAMIAAMPNLQRERAGFTERLGHYLAQPAPKKTYAQLVGKKTIKPQHLLLGDPIEADSKGNASDIPLALHFIELLARIGALHTAPVATRVLSRLIKDCDDTGVWHPKNLRSQPKLQNRAAYHYFPLETESSKHAETRQVDVTFRLALIAKLLGWTTEIR